MKKIIIILIVSIIVIGGLYAASFFLSLRTVSFNLGGEGYVVQVRDEESKKIKEITSSQKMRLPQGNYSYDILGDIYNNKSVMFTVETDTTVNVTPIYLGSYLEKMTEEVKVDILKVLHDTYPSVAGITLTKVSLDETFTWAYGTLTIDSSTDIYRFIVKRKAGNWNVAAAPAIAISKSQNNDIPGSILSSLY